MIEGFVRMLRENGVDISPAERIEASRAVLQVGLQPRATFRAALRTTLAKSAEDARIFDAAFEAYFRPPRPRRGRGKGEGPAGEGGLGGRTAGRPGGAGRLDRPESLLNHDRRDPKRRRPDRRRTAVTRGGETSRTPELQIRREGRGRLRRVVSMKPGRKARIAPGQEPGERGRGVSGPAAVRRRDLRDRVSVEEEAALAREIPAIIQEIRLRRGRRFRGGPRGRLWVKRMIRESLGQGGVPFTLPMRERRPRQPRIVLLVDVSHSVARAAALFTLICLGLSERIRKSAVYFFVDRMVDATDVVRRWAARRPQAVTGRATHARPARGRPEPGAGVRPGGGMPSFADLLNGLPGLNAAAPSDYGAAFFQARQRLARAGGRDTVLVVLGDARTNRRDPLPWAFEEIAMRCRRVLWLNPEPREAWDADDAVMSAYLPFCDVACEVRDLAGLAAGVREILRCL